MTVFAHFSPTPTPLPAAPRRVRGLYRDGCGMWAGRLLIMPHMCIGVAMVVYLALTILYALAGTETQGEATGLLREVGSKGDVSYRVEFAYVHDGKRLRGEQSGLEEEDVRRMGMDPTRAQSAPEVPDDVMDVEALSHGVRVRHVGVGEWRYAGLPDGESPWGVVGFALLFTAFWNGVLSVFVGMLWVWPWRRYWLVKQGEATSGVVTGTSTSRGSKGSTNYHVAYRYTDPVTGRELKGTMSVTSGDYAKAAAGQQVTVIYSAKKPGRSVVYEYCGLRVG